MDRLWNYQDGVGGTSGLAWPCSNNTSYVLFNVTDIHISTLGTGVPHFPELSARMILNQHAMGAAGTDS